MASAELAEPAFAFPWIMVMMPMHNRRPSTKHLHLEISWISVRYGSEMVEHAIG